MGDEVQDPRTVLELVEAIEALRDGLLQARVAGADRRGPPAR
jgi:hypothetical protein